MRFHGPLAQDQRLELRPTPQINHTAKATIKISHQK
jgi:hypothetical protein